MKFFVSSALCLLMTGAAFGQLPECGAVAGWQQQGPARSYTPENLYEYMNGASEGYFIFNFRGMQGITCASGNSTIVIDISDMGDSEYGYGMLSSTLDPRQPLEKIGLSGQIKPQHLVFVKDRYYVELSAQPEIDFSAQLKAYAAAIEKKMREQGSIPEIIGWFPKEGLASDTNAVRLVPESVLGLRMLKSGYVGLYGFGKSFIVREDSPESAAQLMLKLKERFGDTKPARVADEAFTANDKYLNGLCIFRKGNFIGGFANLKDGRDGVAESIKLAENVK